MGNKPRILLPGRDSESKYLEPYAEALRRTGGNPIREWPPMDALSDDSAMEEFLRQYQGVLLPGGIDIEPWRYGEDPHKNLGSTDRDLDEGQLAIARFVLNYDFPALGICRGLQILAVAAGATLYQDIPSQRASCISHQILDPKDHLAHEVALLEGSRLAHVSASCRFLINSRHHQAVRDECLESGHTRLLETISSGTLASDLSLRDSFNFKNEKDKTNTSFLGPFLVTACALDDVIEGMEHSTHRFLIAVQWHPENLILSADAHAPSIRLFQEFVKACR